MSRRIRVVLYAEGTSETGSGAGTPYGLPLAPGSPLPVEELGAAHLLIRAAIEQVSQFDDVCFEEPLRIRGRKASGGDFLNEQQLRQLLRWPRREPDLAIVLVDRDGEAHRKQRLEEWIADLGGETSRIVAVAQEEFEAWLLADIAAVNRTLGTNHQTTSAPESMARREAKGHLAGWIEEIADAPPIPTVYRRIAEHVAIETLAERCASFQQLLDQLTLALR